MFLVFRAGYSSVRWSKYLFYLRGMLVTATKLLFQSQWVNSDRYNDVVCYLEHNELMITVVKLLTCITFSCGHLDIGFLAKAL